MDYLNFVHSLKEHGQTYGIKSFHPRTRDNYPSFFSIPQEVFLLFLMQILHVSHEVYFQTFCVIIFFFTVWTRPFILPSR